MEYCVYIHQNLINNKRYIGITTRKPEHRWGKNGSQYIKNKHFYSAIQKYGWDNFKHIVMYVESRSEMFYLEKYLIAYYNTTNTEFGYNHSIGGEGGGNRGIGTDGYKQHSKMYYIEHKEEIIANVHKYRIEHQNEVKERKKIYAQTHKEELNEYHKKWVEQHKEEYQKYHREYLRNWRLKRNINNNNISE